MVKQGGFIAVSDFLRANRGERASLRKLLSGRETIVAPGAYDALTARLVEQAGFPAVYMTGFGTAASLLGRPDVGLLTMSQMVDNARRIARAVDLARDRRRGHRLWQSTQRDPHGSGVRTRGRFRDPHRRPGHAQEVRAHGEQAGGVRRGDVRKRFALRSEARSLRRVS